MQGAQTFKDYQDIKEERRAVPEWNADCGKII